jgi:hypothetical protein
MTDEAREPNTPRETTALPMDRLIELGQKGQGFLPVGVLPDHLQDQVGGMPVMQARPVEPQAEAPQASPDALLGVVTPQDTQASSSD